MSDPLAHDFYIVRFSFRDRDRRLCTGTYEIDDDRNARGLIVRDIATGQYEHVTHVLEYCADTKRVSDVSEDIARDVAAYLREVGCDEVRGSLVDFLEEFLGVGAVHIYVGAMVA